MGTPVFSHLFFALAGLLAMVLLWRSGERALAAMLAAAFAFTMSFFWISIACDYRYLYFLDLAVIAAWLYLFQVVAMGVLSFWLERSADRKS
jgi:apolipoprotein N-acyltransferase